MSTKIEWCTETWNPIVGCTKVSPGCDHCYAERMANRLKSMSEKYDGNGKNIFHRSATGKYSHVISEKGKWNGKTYFYEADLKKPSRWKKPRMIFVCSMGDLFHESVPFDWIVDVWEVMIKTPHHIYLILTKRPQRALEFTKWFAKETAPVGGEIFPVLPHIWMGVTVENQEQVNIRIPILLQIPAAKRFVSVEPMLGAIDFYDIQRGNEFWDALKGFGDISGSNGQSGGPKLDWVICGGESGPGARPMHPDWVRSLRVQCQAAGTPFFFKQWGEWGPEDQVDENLYNNLITMPVKKWPKHLPQAPHGEKLFFRVGKKATGSILDGKKYKEYPKS